MYLGAEQREAFEAANETLINKVIEALKENNLTLNDARRVLAIVEQRISLGARISEEEFIPKETDLIKAAPLMYKTLSILEAMVLKDTNPDPDDGAMLFSLLGMALDIARGID
jgi:hypothetical protein